MWKYVVSNKLFYCSGLVNKVFYAHFDDIMKDVLDTGKLKMDNICSWSDMNF